MKAQANAADTIAKMLAALLEKFLTLDKRISPTQGDMNRWKEQEQQCEEEMYDVEESFTECRSAPAVDLVMETTTKSKEIPPIKEIEETPVLPLQSAVSSGVPAPSHPQRPNFGQWINTVGQPASSIARTNLGNISPSVSENLLCTGLRNRPRTIRCDTPYDDGLHSVSDDTGKALSSNNRLQQLTSRQRVVSSPTFFCI